MRLLITKKNDKIRLVPIEAQPSIDLYDRRLKVNNFIIDAKIIKAYEEEFDKYYNDVLYMIAYLISDTRNRETLYEVDTKLKKMYLEELGVTNDYIINSHIKLKKNLIKEVDLIDWIKLNDNQELYKNYFSFVEKFIKEKYNYSPFRSFKEFIYIHELYNNHKLINPNFSKVKLLMSKSSEGGVIYEFLEGKQDEKLLSNLILGKSYINIKILNDRIVKSRKQEKLYRASLGKLKKYIELDDLNVYFKALFCEYKFNQGVDFFEKEFYKDVEGGDVNLFKLPSFNKSLDRSIYNEYVRFYRTWCFSKYNVDPFVD